MYKNHCLIFSFLGYLKYVSLLSYAVAQSDEYMILFFLYKWLALCAWTSRVFSLLASLTRVRIGVDNSGFIFQWTMDGVLFQYRCLIFFNFKKILHFGFLYLFCSIAFIFLLQHKLYLCWIFFSCLLYSFSFQSFFFPFFFLLLCQLYFPNSVSDNGGLGCFRTM